MNIQRTLAIGAMAISLAGCGSNTPDPAATAAPSQPAVRTPVTSGGTVPPTLRSTIASTLKVDEGRVVPGASFTADLGADELALVELVMAYERVFKVSIPDADADRFTRVEDVTAYLQRRDVLR